MLNMLKSILKWFDLWEGIEMLKISLSIIHGTATVLHFIYQHWISKTVYCIKCVMVCKIGLTNWNSKIALLRASMVVTYYIKLFRTGANRHNSILMSLLLLVSETINKKAASRFFEHTFFVLQKQPPTDFEYTCIFRITKVTK